MVRPLKSVDRINPRIPWSLVRYLADQLRVRRRHKCMNKVIEVDFLPRETDVAFSWLDSLGHSSQRRIVIIDDDKNTTHLVKVLLEKTGRHMVLEENDSTGAYQTARNFRPDLIFLDRDMSEKNVAEIAGQILASLQPQYTPIIFLTAHGTRAEANSSLQVHKHPVLGKPIDVQELINSIEAHMPPYSQGVRYDKLA